MLLNKQKKFSIALAASLLALSGCSDPVLKLEAVQKPKGLSPGEQEIHEQLTQNRQLKVITLPNKLQVALVSDPGAATSSASMDVPVGLYSDPPQYRGLAHYLEHMLFIGTAKYPDPSGWHAFLEKNGGQSNAYTGNDNTNYFFQVNTSAFERTLDMFAGFFTDPVFNPTYIPREIKNVDSEYQKNRENSFWRNMYLQHQLSDEGSPRRLYFQGSNETLGSVPREVLLDFHKRYYSANLMKLALVSSLPLDQLEALVREKFASVPNNESPAVDLRGQPLRESRLPQLVELKSSDEARLLWISFDLPSDMAHTAEKPFNLIKANLGYFGPGSLDASLKRRGLIQSIEFDSDSYQHGSTFGILVSLTEEGSSRYKEVTKDIFAYLKQLRAHGLSKDIFDDTAQMAKLSYLYGTPLRGTSVNTYSKALNNLGAENLEGKLFLYTKFDPALYQSYMDLLVPEKASIFFTAPEVTGRSKADFYDIEYNETKLAGDPWLKELQDVPASSHTLLGKNPFITTDTTLVDSAGRTAKRLFANEFGALWVAPSKDQQPKASIRLSLVKPSQGGAREAAVSALYQAALTRVLDEWGDNARNAWISFKITSSPKRLQLEIDGFSEKLGAFAADLAGQVKGLTISEEEFAIVRQGVITSIEQAKRDMAYTRASSLSAGLIGVGSVDLDEYAPELSKVTLAELLQYSASVAAQSSLEIAVIGNISDDAAKGLFEAVAARLGTVPVAPEARKPSVVEVSLPPGKSFAIARVGDTNNHAWISSFQFGPASDPSAAALANLAGVFVGDSFFEEMRTNRSLGYIVGASASRSTLFSWLRFVIQSDKPADELARNALPWIQERIEASRKMSEESFALLKSGLVENLLAPKDSLKAEVTEFREAIDARGEDFEFTKKLAEAVGKVTKEEFTAALENALGEASRRQISVYLAARGAPSSEMKGETPVSSAGELHKLVPHAVKPVAR